MISVKNISKQVIQLSMSDKMVRLQSRASLVLDEKLVNNQMKNLEKMGVIKITRV